MRTDEMHQPCPETLGEYRDLCAAFGRAAGVPHNAAVEFLDGKIAESPRGRDEPVLAADAQMRAILMPMLLQPGGPDERPTHRRRPRRAR